MLSVYSFLLSDKLGYDSGWPLFLLPPQALGMNPCQPSPATASSPGDFTREIKKYRKRFLYKKFLLGGILISLRFEEKPRLLNKITN